MEGSVVRQVETERQYEEGVEEKLAAYQALSARKKYAANTMYADFRKKIWVRCIPRARFN
jgi:hypothetical protein